MQNTRGKWFVNRLLLPTYATMQFPALIPSVFFQPFLSSCSLSAWSFQKEQGVDIFMFNSLILWREVNAVLRCVILELWIVWGSELMVIMETSYEGFHSFIFFSQFFFFFFLYFLSFF